MNDPIFSVIVPAYNKGEMLGNTISSVLAQKFADYEMIIVDDGSTDNTAEIVRAFKDPRIRYYYQPNSGLPAAARNNGIKYSRGRYIAFLDADDVWYSDKLRRCYDVFNKYSDADLVCHDELIRNVSGTVIKKVSYGPYIPEMFRRLLFKGNCLSPSAVVVKQEALINDGPIFREYPEFFAAEDYDLWLRLSKKHKFYFIAETLGEYLLHDKNISSGEERYYNNQIAVVGKNFEEYMEKRALDRLLVNLRISKMYLLIARYFIRLKKPGKVFEYILKATLRIFKYA